VDDLQDAIDTVCLSTIESPSRHRRRARQKLLEIWSTVVEVARELERPVPPFRPDVTGYRPTVRHRADEYEPIADFRPVSLPAPLLEAAQ